MFFNTKSIKIGFVIAQVFLTLCLASCGNEPDNTVIINAYKHQINTTPVGQIGLIELLGSTADFKSYEKDPAYIAKPSSFLVINSYSREKNGETLFIYKCSMTYERNSEMWPESRVKKVESDLKERKIDYAKIPEPSVTPILTFAMVKRGKEWFVVDAPN